MYGSHAVTVETHSTSYGRRLEKLYLGGGQEAVDRYREKERWRAAIARADMTDQQRTEYNKKSRIRQAKYR